jgi:hypothetical protein
MKKFQEYPKHIQRIIMIAVLAAIAIIGLIFTHYNRDYSTNELECMASCLNSCVNRGTDIDKCHSICRDACLR